jgi:hypothetical protein
MELSLNQSDAAQNKTSGYKHERYFLTQLHRRFIVAENSQLWSFVMSVCSAHPGAISHVKPAAKTPRRPPNPSSILPTACSPGLQPGWELHLASPFDLKIPAFEIAPLL